MSIIARLASGLRRVGPALLVVVALAVVGTVFVVDTPRWLRLGVFAGVLSLVVGWWPAGRIVDYFYQPLYVLLLVVDREAMQLRMWRMSPDRFSELTIVNGELTQWEAAVPIYEAQAYDPEAHEAEGTWRGSASTLELIQADQRLDEVYGRLQVMARQGMRHRVSYLTIVRESVQEIVGEIISSFERSAVPSGEDIDQTIEKHLPEELDRDQDPDSLLSRVEDLEDDTDDVIDDMDLDQEAPADD